MNQEFVITGMTCQNCKKGVESKLNSIDEISKFLVDLESGLTQIEVSSLLDLTFIEEVLGSKYKVMGVETEHSISKLSALSP